jgi:hypothetical protein
MKNKMLKSAVVAVVAVALAQTVQATPIGGAIAFSGGASLNTGNANTATEVISWTGVTVTSESGAFTPILTGTPVSLQSPWFFNSAPGYIPALTSFWSVGTFTFNLLSSSIASQSGGFLNVNIAGTVTSSTPGLDPTAFNGTFQVANPPGVGSLGDPAAIFSARLSFSSVPDGGTTVLLLGAALSGLALLKRKFAA